MTHLLAFAGGILVGIAFALFYNHKRPEKFDDITDAADRKVDELRKKK